MPFDAGRETKVRGDKLLAEGAMVHGLGRKVTFGDLGLGGREGCSVTNPSLRILNAAKGTVEDDRGIFGRAYKTSDAVRRGTVIAKPLALTDVTEHVHAVMI